MPAFVQRRIHQLSVQLANQIAAGEVVERPASVVKELLENSLDAGATQIEIEIEQGGLRRIRIVDNGCGIHAEDLPLALSRHATSKLLSLEELAQIASLGFRGEALPSIASVSRLQLISRQVGSEQGHCLEVDAQGQHSDVKPAAHPPGTSVIVEELFCNAPARRRFMRAAKTEFNHVQDVVQRIALGAPAVAITLRHNERQVLRLAAASDEATYQRRLGQVFGQSFIEVALPVSGQSDGIHITGFVAPASLHRSQADHQYVYINGRMIRDRLVNHAIRQAYADNLPAGRYASYILKIDLEPSRVDVNVHPTKHEVRFRDGRLLHDFLFSVINRSLQGEGAAGYAVAAVNSGAVVQERNALYLVSSRPDTANKTHSRRLPFGEPLQLLHRRFLLCRDEERLWLLDTQGLLTAMNNKRLQQALVDTGMIKSRPLLLPQRIMLKAGQVEQLMSASQRMSRLGFELTQVDDGTLLLRTAPMLLQTAPAEALLQAVLSHLHADDQTVLQRLAEAAAITSPLPESVPALREWLGVQLNMLDVLPATVPWARVLEAKTLEQWLKP
ncbi:DNA mismatch repair endonuclease MutL [Sulfuriflexus mobilis]|uniref:DNA mismatch repair endonuclease MutL n=1 Tax=Sulfuriflexus mobilis TaxID=1811807 RepID=UPI000F830337|nr:DNA mismatch repair endonuclease MutL [Sulfuriflexus mobilis]